MEKYFKLLKSINLIFRDFKDPEYNFQIKNNFLEIYIKNYYASIKLIESVEIISEKVKVIITLNNLNNA